ncbi:MAG: tetratricopeptide repeat protein, partial [Deinococcota bacterium]
MTALFAAGAGFLEMLPHFKTLHQNRARYQRLAQALETETTRLLTNSNDTEQEALIKRCCELFTLQQYSLSKQEMREIQDADEASNIILTRAKPYLDTLAPDEADVLQHLIRVCYAVVFPEKEHILELIDGDDINFVEVKEALEHIQQNLTDLPIAIQEEHFEAVHDAKQFSAMLLLDIPQKQYREGFTSPTMLLRADLRRPVPFHFREGTVADIRAWCDDDAPLKLQVYEGQGGTGKTRLFLEVCRMYRAQGWEAGFLQLNPGNSNTEELWPYLFQGQTPMLVVLDYAERQATEEFQRLLVAMYEATMGQHLAKLRIVLLTRTTGDWWEQLQEDSALSNYLSSETVEPPKVLPSLTSVESDDLETQQQRRNESLMRAASHFAELRDKDVPTAPDDLSATYFERALYLHLQALASVEGEGVLSEARLLDFILNREKQFLREQLRARDLRESLLDSDALLQAVVVFTAMQGLHTREEALSVLEQLSLLQGLAPDELAAVADLLHETYAGVQWIEPIMPDILIEELYSRHATDEVLAIMLDHENADVLRVLNHINALAQRRSEQCALLKFAFQGRMDKLWQAGIEVTLSTGDPIGQVMADVLTDNPDATLAKTIYAAIPRYTVVLRELSAAAAQQVYDTVATGDLEQKATWAHNLAVHLGEVGKKKDALATAQEATRTYRRLVTTHSKEFLPYLATSLNNLGTRFNALNRHKEALAALEEAVSIRRKLDSDHPYDFLP